MNNWEEKTWKQVVDIRNGKNQKQVENPNGKYPIYGSGGVFGYANDFLCPENTTIIGRKGSINNPIYVETKFWNVDTAFGLVAKDGLKPKFLHYFCLGFDFTRLNKSTTLPSLTKKNLSEIKIPLPPLPEQRRIVSKLDALFTEIDASLVLIDQNIEQAEALKLSVLDEEFSAIKKQGNIFKIKDVAYTQSGATPRRSTKSYWDNGDIPWLKSGELSDNKNIIENSEFITQEGLENSSTKLFPEGTLLMAMYGATAGKLGILGMKACTNQAVCSIQNNKDLFIEEYLYYFLLMIREQIILDSFGGAQPNISKGYINNLEVPFPKTKAIQQKIVQKLDSIFEEIDGLVNDYKKKRENLEALKSSILDQAFKGKL